MSTPTRLPTEQIPAHKPGEEGDPFRFGWRFVWRKDENGLMKQVQVPLTFEDVLHPQEEDFIVQNGPHDTDCHYLKSAVLIALDGRDDVEVLHDVRVDWEVEGVKPHGPDLAVFVNVRKPWKHNGGTFHVKAIGARPLLVIEVTSPTTRAHDIDTKVVEYYKAGVPFYAIVDYYPELEQRQVHVLGYRATPDGYVRVDLNDQERLWLDSVRLWLASAGELAVCFDDLGVRVPSVQELNRGKQQAEQAALLAQQQAADAVSGKQQAEQAALLAQQQAADAVSGKQQAEQAALLAQQQAANALSGKQQAEEDARLAQQQAADAVSGKQQAEQAALLAQQQAANALSGKQQAEEDARLAQQQAADAVSGKQQAEQAALLAQQQAANALSGKQQAEEAALLAQQQAANLAARLAELEAAMRGLRGPDDSTTAG